MDLPLGLRAARSAVWRHELRARAETRDVPVVIVTGTEALLLIETMLRPYAFVY